MVRLICHKSSVQTRGIVCAKAIVWKPEVAFELWEYHPVVFDNITSIVDHTAHNADALQSPAGLETGIAIIDTVSGSVGPVQSAFVYTGSMKGTLDCLTDTSTESSGLSRTLLKWVFYSAVF
jgi:hypothetical protein